MLGLQLSYRCNAVCRACAFDCGPDQNLCMSFENAKKVLDHAHELNLNPVIGLTGGEPFFNPGFLKKLCAYITASLGFKISISTNAFWAESEKQAADVLKELSDLGLVALLISADPFHQEFVPFSYIRNAVRAALDLDMQCILQSMETRTGKKAGEYLKDLGLGSDENRVRSVAIACDPVGRARREVHDDEWVYQWQSRAGSCSMLRMWITDPSGKVFPCCGTGIKSLTGLGNAFEDSIVDIIHHYNADPLLNALAAWGGPYLLFKILADAGFDHYAGNTYAGACHACHSLFKDPEAMTVIKDNLSHRRVELMAARLMARASEAEWRLTGNTNVYAVPAAW